jgi:multiple sugar transport system substrate-binding protein
MLGGVTVLSAGALVLAGCAGFGGGGGGGDDADSQSLTFTTWGSEA